MFAASQSSAPHRLYNIGNNNWVELRRYIEVLEECLGRKAEKNLLPLQPGDVPDTYADVDDLVNEIGYRPNPSIEVRRWAFEHADPPRVGRYRSVARIRITVA